MTYGDTNTEDNLKEDLDFMESFILHMESLSVLMHTQKDGWLKYPVMMVPMQPHG